MVLSLVIIHVSNRSAIEASYGREAFRRVSRDIEAAVQTVLGRPPRQSASAGEDFVAVLPGAYLDQARAAAVRIRRRLPREVSEHGLITPVELVIEIETVDHGARTVETISARPPLRRQRAA
jgi:GGDEF domain-containing protein